MTTKAKHCVSQEEEKIPASGEQSACGERREVSVKNLRSAVLAGPLHREPL